jgi:allantoicase
MMEQAENSRSEPGSLSPWIDLAAARIGGQALLANDEFFAPKENLLLPGRGVFIADKYTEKGKWMDGWETRRRRQPGHDWVVLRLGLPGVIQQVLADTNHFRGNFPEACSIESLVAAQDASGEDLARREDWRELLPRSLLEGHSENFFLPEAREVATHIRFNIFPDGGVARLRLLGEVKPDWAPILAAGKAVDLVSVQLGGRPIDCSDSFFSQPQNLIMPGRGKDMGDGWETRRRRGPGHDWVILALGRRARLQHAQVDTHHFKGNYPESCSLEVCDLEGADAERLRSPEIPWQELLPRTRLKAHREHPFPLAPKAGPATHVRMRIYPDGGVSRLRLFGLPI